MNDIAFSPLPFVVGGPCLELRPQMRNPANREVIGLLLAKPGCALTGEDIRAIGFAGLGVGGWEIEILVQRPPSLIVLVDRAGFAAFGANYGDGAGALVEDTMIDLQCGYLADLQTRPIAQGKDRTQARRVGTFDEGSQYVALVNLHGVAVSLPKCDVRNCAMSSSDCTACGNVR